MEPILHLSIPVRDLPESIDFYGATLGCALGRVRDTFADVWFFGMQVTLHERPDQVLADQVLTAESCGVRHFGVTLSADAMDALLARVVARGVVFASELTTDYPGTDKEQTKATILDPSGNVIEVKTYVDPAAALGPH